MSEDKRSGAHRRKPDNRWHFRKEIHAGHIVTTLMIVLGALSAYFDLDKRIDQEKYKNVAQDERFEQHISSTNHSLTEIKKDVRDIRNTIINKYNK